MALYDVRGRIRVKLVDVIIGHAGNLARTRLSVPRGPLDLKELGEESSKSLRFSCNPRVSLRVRAGVSKTRVKRPMLLSDMHDTWHVEGNCQCLGVLWI